MIQERVDKIELQLTPKQWAVRLANEMRRYPSEQLFLSAIAKGSYRQSPDIAPLYVLALQAEQSGRSQKNTPAVIQLSRKLREEFIALKILITNANKIIKNRAVTCRVKAALRLSELQAMLLEDAFWQTARKAAIWIEACPPSTPDAEVERQLILKELLVLAGKDIADTEPEIAPKVTPPVRLSQLTDWADNSTVLLVEIIAHKTAVQIIQERYFDNRPILFKDTEAAFETANLAVRDAIFLFGKYQKGVDDPPKRGQCQDSKNADGEPKDDLSIDIQAVEQRAKLLADSIVDGWVTAAKNKGIGDILAETHEHEDFVWQNFRKGLGLQS